MDYESLVEEVTKRVLERLAEVKTPSVSKERRVAELAKDYAHDNAVDILRE